MQIQIQILLALIIFIIQPVFWVGLIRTYLLSKKRIKNTRNTFHNAIYPRHFEIVQFFINLFLLGILGAAFTVTVGPVMTMVWLVIYQVLSIINLLLIPRVIFSFEILTIALITTIVINLSGVINRFIHVESLRKYGISLAATGDFNYIFLASLFLLGLAIIVFKDGGKYNVPIIEHNERKTRIAGYPFRSINVVPLFLFIPGDFIHSTIPFWPVFMLNGHSFAFLFAPILFGFRMTVFKLFPRAVFKKLGGQFAKLAILGLLLTIVSYFFPIIVVPALVGLLLIFWWINIHAKSVDKGSGDWYSEVINGVRIVGIEPQTPAAKMNLSIGDVILEVNNQSVTNENEFYRALLKQSTYCRLKVKNRKGQLAITETAIFSNAPHEIGVVLFKQES